MSRSIFGWDLPPGVTHSMIDSLACSESILESFEQDPNTRLCKQEEDALDTIYSDSILCGLVEMAMVWAYEKGLNEGKGD